MYTWALCGSFPCDSPPKSVSKGAPFGGFLKFEKVVFLVEILRFLLIQWVLVDQIVAMGCPWGTSTIPQSHVRIRGVNREIRIWIWRGWPRRDRCMWLIRPVQGPSGFASGQLPDLCGFGMWCYWLVLGRFQRVFLGFVMVFLLLQFEIGGGFCSSA
jgi:hypothetical protein